MEPAAESNKPPAQPGVILTGNRIAVLDGLRGIAIAVVVLYHLWIATLFSLRLPVFGRTLDGQFLAETGFTGVYLFFFISGFVLFYPHARHVFGGSGPKGPALQSAGGRAVQSVGDFAYRRFIKIVPSYVLLLILLLPWLAASLPAKTLAWQYATHLLFMHNWFLSTIEGINPVLWTLAVEVQFYVLFPLLSWSFRTRPLLTYLALVAIANIYRYKILQCCAGNPVAVYQLPAFLDLFAAGMLGAWLFEYFSARRESQRWTWAYTIVGIVCFIAYFVALRAMQNASVLPELQHVWLLSRLTPLSLDLTAFAVASCLAARWWQSLLANKVLVFLAVISYNLYLWHLVLITFLLEHHLPSPRPQAFAADHAWQWSFALFATAACVAVASLVTYCFERPLLKRGFRALSDVFAPKPVQSVE